MREKLQELFNQINNEEVFIIGGGPSVNHIDITKLYNKKIICINNAYKLFSNATALYWCDESWIGKHLDNVLSHACKLRFTAKHSADNYISNNLFATGNATVLRRTAEKGFDDNVDNVKGNNSGSQVINLCANMKVKRIILLGYDMHMKNNKSHWHNGHGIAMRPDIYRDLFIPNMKSLVLPLSQLGIPIINCSYGSSLDCFPMASLDDVLEGKI